MADRIALLAIYGPMIKKEIETFVDTWNMHKIRVHKKRRPWVIGGRPWYLYNDPDGLNYGRKVNLEALKGLQREVDKGPKTYGFLPPSTLELCREFVASTGFDLDSLEAGSYHPDGVRLHKEHYLKLRDNLRAHGESGRMPQLSEFKKPTKDSGLPYAIRKGFGGEDLSSESSSSEHDVSSADEGIRSFDLEGQEPWDGDLEKETFDETTEDDSDGDTQSDERL